MFNPSRDQARRFFIDAWAKHRAQTVLTPMEDLAVRIIDIHPEYHATLEHGEAAIERDWTPEMGESNPFLHLSLHLAIEEQLSIDQPPGIRGTFNSLHEKRQDRHAALHGVLDCLGEMIWRAQRDGTAMDAAGYLACIKNRAAK